MDQTALVLKGSLCCLQGRHFAFTVPLSTSVYECVLVPSIANVTVKILQDSTPILKEFLQDLLNVCSILTKTPFLVSILMNATRSHRILPVHVRSSTLDLRVTSGILQLVKSLAPSRQSSLYIPL